jgi:hypothetical protein
MAKIGNGASVTVNDGSGGVGSAAAVILDIISINVPDPEYGVVQSKRLNLTGDALVYLPTLKDPGQFSFDYESNTGKKTRLDTLLGSERSFVITVPTDSGSAYTRTVTGYIISNKLTTIEADKIQVATCVVQVTGVIA